MWRFICQNSGNLAVIYCIAQRLKLFTRLNGLFSWFLNIFLIKIFFGRVFFLVLLVSDIFFFIIVWILIYINSHIFLIFSLLNFCVFLFKLVNFLNRIQLSQYFSGYKGSILLPKFIVARGIRPQVTIKMKILYSLPVPFSLCTFKFKKNLIFWRPLKNKYLSL